MIGGVLLAVLMASSSWFDSPVWLLIVLLILLGALVLAYLLAFRYLLLNDPDALRSESFILKRTALEHRLEGDSIYGVIQSSDGADRLLLTKAEKDVEA